MQNQAIKQVRTILAEIHKFSPTDEKSPRHATLQLCFRDRQRHHPGHILLIVVGFFQPAVAGVGIMNIMLFCVEERTREIGLPQGTGCPTLAHSPAVSGRVTRP